MDSTAVEFNVDGLPPVSMAEVEDLCRQIGDMAVRYCGGRVRYDMLSAARRRIRISE